jgi:putative restriction endonuclease
MKAWIVIAPDGDCAAAPFNCAASYRFDDRIPHHNQISAGDLFFFRNKARLIAVARVGDIALRREWQQVERCPVCGSSELGERTRRKAKFRCALGHEFLETASDKRQAKLYDVSFGVDHTTVAAAVTYDELRYFELTNSAQLAIRPCDIDGLIRLLARRAPTAVTLIKAWIADGSFELSDRDGDRHNFGLAVDSRERVRTGIRLRRGDEDFRQNLFQRYGERCMVSGCAISGLIEAAYILPRTTFRLSRPGNGLLLRADLHTLFDLDLIGIAPARLAVAIHPKLSDTEYAQFSGAPLETATGKAPSGRALELRWREFQAGARNTEFAGSESDALKFAQPHGIEHLAWDRTSPSTRR